MSVENLQAAKAAKADEFYTQLEDIERELKHYRAFFSGKIVYCNCDDNSSNFVKYFKEHFDELGLKKLLYSGYKITPSGVDKSTGDFRSAECIELLKEADVVVTNPPFSLFREFVAQLMHYQKFFVILGNKNAITYKEIFPLIQKNKMFVGYTSMSKEIYFHVPQKYIDAGLAANKDRTIVKIEGEYVSRSASIWFTNIPLKKQNEELPLVCSYYENPERYPKYDNYDAIEVSKTADIPCDYFGEMGVPITFMDKYNPAQFELLKYIRGGQLGKRWTYKRLIIRQRGLKSTST